MAKPMRNLERLKQIMQIVVVLVAAVGVVVVWQELREELGKSLRV